MSDFYLYGAGGHGKVVLDAMYKSSMNCAAFIDDKNTTTWCDLPVIQSNQIQPTFKLHIAIGNSQVRQSIAKTKLDSDFFSVIHPRASLANPKLTLIGVFIAANAVIGPDVSIGKHTIINHGAVVDHDCIVGNFCHIAPNAVLGGGAKLGDHVLIGAGAVILPAITIGDNVTIGAGAVVTRNVPSNTVLIGVPAKSLPQSI